MRKCKYGRQQWKNKYTLLVLQFRETGNQKNLKKYCRVCLQLRLTGRFIETETNVIWKMSCRNIRFPWSKILVFFCFFLRFWNWICPTHNCWSLFGNYPCQIWSKRLTDGALLHYVGKKTVANDARISQRYSGCGISRRSLKLFL